MKLLAVQVHCSESTQQWWTNETLSIKQQLLFIATQCCRLNCRNAHRCTTHCFTKVFNANARSFVRKCAHCLKWRWSSPGSGSRCTIAVFVHHWCTIAALSRSQRYTAMYYHALTMLQYHQHAQCELSSLCMHIMEILIIVALSHSQQYTVALSSYHDSVAILHYHALTILS